MQNTIWRIVGINYNLEGVEIVAGLNYVHLLAGESPLSIGLKMESISTDSIWAQTLLSPNCFFATHCSLHMNGDGSEPEEDDPFLTLSLHNSHSEANSAGIEAMWYLENDKGYLVGECRDGLTFWYSNQSGEGWKLKSGSVSEFIHDVEQFREDEEIDEEIDEAFKYNYPLDQWKRDVALWVEMSHGGDIIRRNLDSGNYLGTREELLEAARPIILDGFRRFVGLVRDSSDSIDWMIRRAENFDGLGVTKQELMNSVEDLIFEGWEEATSLFMRDYYVHPIIPIKKIKLIEKAGYDVNKYKAVLQNTLIDNTKKYVEIFISNPNSMEMITKKVDSLLPLVINAAEFKGEIGSYIIGLYDSLSERVKAMLERKDIWKWVGYAIKAGLPADYLTFINNSPELVLDEDSLLRAKKLTKAYRLLKRKPA